MWMCDGCRVEGGWAINTARQFQACEMCGRERLCYMINNKVEAPDECAHCGKITSQYAIAYGFKLCNEDPSDPRSCYMKVTFYRHPLHPCGKCAKETV